jgi:hypothetical protein
MFHFIKKKLAKFFSSNPISQIKELQEIVSKTSVKDERINYVRMSEGDLPFPYKQREEPLSPLDLSPFVAYPFKSIHGRLLDGHHRAIAVAEVIQEMKKEEINLKDQLIDLSEKNDILKKELQQAIHRNLLSVQSHGETINKMYALHQQNLSLNFELQEKKIKIKTAFIEGIKLGRSNADEDQINTALHNLTHFS